MSDKDKYSLCPSCGNMLHHGYMFCVFCEVENRKTTFYNKGTRLLNFLRKLKIYPGKTKRSLSGEGQPNATEEKEHDTHDGG